MYIIPVVVCFVLVLIDQIIKFVCIKYLMPIGSFTVIDKFFYLTYVENEGAAFGLFSGARWFFIAITIIMLFVLGWYYLKIPKSNITIFLKMSVIMIVAGAFGNFLDRLIKGYVVDMFHFVFWGHSFAVFNFADILVVCGTAIVAVFIVFLNPKDTKQYTE